MEIKILAENIKRLREEHNLTQEALAESLGVPELTVYRWEAGRELPGFKTIKKIAEFFETSAEALVNNTPDDGKDSAASDKVSFNCRICGGDLVYNYTDGTCKCANCGNKWSIAAMYPKYAGIMATINKATRILNGRADLASADDADLLFRQAIIECSKFNDEVSSELIKICTEGQAKADQLEIYCRGKHFFDNKAYKSALKELEKVRGFRNADDMIKRCKRQA
ncbi:MAG: helix-turn-helix domain-containing protein [Saccharofermentans sp.]|nr:helix-turn-helix domain-containing protein [Saccharofermentans sp.]